MRRNRFRLTSWARGLLLSCLPLLACAHRAASSPPPSPAVAGPPSAAEVVTISVVGTTDVHGHIESLPWLASHVANLRARRARDGGAVLLVDSGDMFQGTLESNLTEGAAMVRAYNALGYAAAAIGNHEFDFGPAGPAHIPTTDGDDPRGALKARAVQANFPFLAGNLRERATHKMVSWPHVQPYTVVTVAGVRVGVVGMLTADAPHATHPRNFVGLEMAPLAESIAASARQARAEGAVAVVVVAHAGGHCTRFESPDDLSSCDPSEEIFAVARALPPGLVDLISAGHTHQGVAHRVAGIPIVQGMSDGRAFARADLRIDRARGVLGVQIFPPHLMCGGSRVPSFAPDACHPGDYEGQPVQLDARMAATIAPDIANAAARRAQPIGVTLTGRLERGLKVESPLGNFTADLMHALRPDTDVAFINGGSLRSDLPAGPLSYGRLYETFPFDDGLALVHLRADQLAALLARNLTRDAGILSLSGLRADAHCAHGHLDVRLFRADGTPVDSRTPLVAITNGYLASGGDGLLAGIATGDEPTATTMRDQFADSLHARGGEIQVTAPTLFDPTHPRLTYPTPRPVHCPP